MFKYKVRHFLFVIKANIALAAYKARHWALQWKTDHEGDITLVVLGVINLTKYKEHTVISFGNKDYKDARKYVDAVEEPQYN